MSAAALGIEPNGPTTRRVLHRAGRGLGCCLLLLLAASLVACQRRPPSFILIVVDALRADCFSALGDDVVRSAGSGEPKLGAVRFERAYAPSSWTFPSVVSLKTSRSLSQHGAVRWGATLPEGERVLEEVLKDAGYATAGWSANPLVIRARGLHRGFDDYEFLKTRELLERGLDDPLVSWVPVSELSSRALAWLGDREARGSQAPFYLYLHAMETHTPYPCPEGAGAECEAARSGLNLRLVREDWRFDSAERETIHRLYDAGVTRAAAGLREFVEELSARGWLEGTWVIVTGDHGEMLGEHGLFVHGKTLFEPVVHVPLLFIGDVRGELAVEEPVSLIDVAPTILDLAGIEKPQAFEGRSLRAALRGRRLEPRPVLSEYFRPAPERGGGSSQRLAVIDGTTKMLLFADGSASRVDLGEDPAELHPVSVPAPEVLGRLGGALRLVDLDREADLGSEELSPRALEELRALGYVE